MPERVGSPTLAKARSTSLDCASIRMPVRVAIQVLPIFSSERLAKLAGLDAFFTGFVRNRIDLVLDLFLLVF